MSCHIDQGAEPFKILHLKHLEIRMYEIISYKISFKFRVFHKLFMKHNLLDPYAKALMSLSIEGFKPSMCLKTPVLIKNGGVSHEH